MPQETLPEVVQRLLKLPEWRVKKLHDFELIANLRALKELEKDLQSKRDWVYRWTSLLEDEVSHRAEVVAAIQRRKEYDARKEKEIAERNEALERKYLSDQYAE